MINPGTILMQSTAAHPQCFHLEDGWYPNAWRALRQDLTHQQFEKELSAAGWTFFYMAHSVAAIAFGFARAKMISTALKRVISRVKQENCNCLEIETVETHSFLGMPYVRVSAYPRHIQKGSVFAGQ
ncbi:MAG: hypothetical protein IH602_12930 [Bryobacteraceae bacterium]|nr:hypothetical protein [Bryobacteraceae bacterium]